jgi:hypothetical protein
MWKTICAAGRRGCDDAVTGGLVACRNDRQLRPSQLSSVDLPALRPTSAGAGSRHARLFLGGGALDLHLPDAAAVHRLTVSGSRVSTLSPPGNRPPVSTTLTVS